MLFLRGSPAGSPADLTIFSALALVIDSLVSFFLYLFLLLHQILRRNCQRKVFPNQIPRSASETTLLVLSLNSFFGFFIRSAGSPGDTGG